MTNLISIVGVMCFAVERRRRDKINNWIVQLSKLVPDCNPDHTKSGQVSSNASISFSIFIYALLCLTN